MTSKDIYVYPAVFEKTATGYSVMFPDLPGCFTVGKTLEEAHTMAREALGLHLWGFEQDGEEIPKPSLVDTLQNEYHGEVIGLVEVSLSTFRAKLDTRAVKKTLTIPYYLNQMAEKRKINFSQELQTALKKRLGIN
ncbi:MAG: HicB like antitoxin of bacterial toxin-antitoxin system [Firmicutes bacterium]|nr:HicB like antitoxin of bacterial toxin-antitoxin system [Bacillota bacterium]